MSDESQIVVPASFVALFLAPGRLRPSAPREHILARYEHCEDLATLLTEHARTRLWELGIAESDVLERIGRGLQAEGSGVSAPEAAWVIRRLAELLGWELPAGGLEPAGGA
jgi:hypothetical protein